jgi:Response regulator containing CheY-like receiver domain and AraC-type DNA-binding domain
MQAIQQINNEQSLEILKQINTLERAQLSKHPLVSLKYSLIGSCTLFTRAVIEAGLDSETAFILSDYYINLIDIASSLKQAQDLEYKMVNDFIRVLKKHREYIYNPLINSVIRYMKKNIEHNLSLKEISSLVNVHPNYLSAAFKKDVGKTLTDYFNELRIEAIKQYMDNTNVSIREISYTFNFSHVTYFCRFFKKHTGLTPKAYKKQSSNKYLLLE